MTRSEIKNNIDNYKSKIKNCRSKEDKYSLSLTYANDLVTNLNKSKDSIVKAESNLKNSYAMAGKIGKNSDIQSIKHILDNSINDLTNIVIPKIDKEIRSLQSMINRYESRISSLWDDYYACEE